MRLGRLLAALLVTPLLALPAAAGAHAPARADEDPCAAATIVGTDGDDDLRGTPGPDVISGLGGDDRLLGGGGADVLCGGEGADDLIGGPGDDELYGGADRFVDLEEVSRYEGDDLDGGPGDDRLDGGLDPRRPFPRDAVVFDSAASGVTVDLGAGTAEGDGSDTLVGDFRQVRGSAHDDVLRGSDRGDLLVGGLGADLIIGRGGDDTLRAGLGGRDSGGPNVVFGGPGKDYVEAHSVGDRLSGGPASDFMTATGAAEMRGGGGWDYLYLDLARRGPQVVTGGAGRDTAHVSTPKAWIGTGREVTRGRADLASGRAVLRSRAGDVRFGLGALEALQVTSSGWWTVLGTAGRDKLDVLAGGALLVGRAGDDALLGTWADDVLRGGPGRDAADGRGGHDRYESVERRVRG